MYLKFKNKIKTAYLNVKNENGWRLDYEVFFVCPINIVNVVTGPCK